MQQFTFAVAVSARSSKLCTRRELRLSVDWVDEPITVLIMLLANYYHHRIDSLLIKIWVQTRLQLYARLIPFDDTYLSRSLMLICLWSVRDLAIKLMTLSDQLWYKSATGCIRLPACNDIGYCNLFFFCWSVPRRVCRAESSDYTYKITYLIY